MQQLLAMLFIGASKVITCFVVSGSDLKLSACHIREPLQLKIIRMLGFMVSGSDHIYDFHQVLPDLDVYIISFNNNEKAFQLKKRKAE